MCRRGSRGRPLPLPGASCQWWLSALNATVRQADADLTQPSPGAAVRLFGSARCLRGFRLRRSGEAWAASVSCQPGRAPARPDVLVPHCSWGKASQRTARAGCAAVPALWGDKRSRVTIVVHPTKHGPFVSASPASSATRIWQFAALLWWHRASTTTQPVWEPSKTLFPTLQYPGPPGAGSHRGCRDVFSWCPQGHSPLRPGWVLAPPLLPQSSGCSDRSDCPDCSDSRNSVRCAYFPALTVRFITRRFIGDYDPTLGR